MDVIEKKVVLKTWPFTVEELTLSHEGQPFSHPYHRLVCADWANIVAVTPDRRVIMVRQPRAGSLKSVLEIPGGAIDAHEKDATMAAVRELEEETGFTTQRVLPLAVMNPNPAIMSNRCHFFLGLGCLPATDRKHFPDAEERITVELHDFDALDHMIRTGQIDHGISALGIMLAAKYLPAPTKP